MNKRQQAAVKEAAGKPVAGGSQVSFRTRRLEGGLMTAIVIFTFWACAVLTPGELIAWMIAAYVAAIGAWSRVKPAVHESMLFIRGALLLAGAFVLQSSSIGGGAGGPYFIWPIMIVAVYSLLLRDRWLAPLWILAAAEFVAARMFDPITPSWQITLLQAGALMFFAYAGREFGRSIRGLDQEAETARKDKTSRLYNEAGFFDHGSQLFDECRSRKRPFTLVLLNSADLREVADVSGKKAANHLFLQLVDRIAAATPPEGLSARTDAVEFALALPGMTPVRAAQLLEQTLGNPPKVEATLKGNLITVILNSAIAETTPDVPTLEDMYDRLRAKLLRRSGEESHDSSDQPSTLQGMLESEPMLPHNAKPTMPMAYPKAS